LTFLAAEFHTRNEPR